MILLEKDFFLFNFSILFNEYFFSLVQYKKKTFKLDIETRWSTRDVATAHPDWSGFQC